MHAREQAKEEAAEAGVRDPQMTSKVQAEKTAFINQLLRKLRDMNLKSYDDELEHRITTFDHAADYEQLLRTLERLSIASGTARIITTRFADVLISIDNAADSAPAAATSSGNADSHDDLRNIQE
eukprot:6198249-Pleurochrysis_carterae.AAC.2